MACAARLPFRKLHQGLSVVQREAHALQQTRVIERPAGGAHPISDGFTESVVRTLEPFGPFWFIVDHTHLVEQPVARRLQQ